jgi:hypothetical protein
VYNAWLQFLIPRRPQMLASGYVSTLGDGLLDIAMVAVGGGFDSPFYFILFTVTIAAAMRYGYGPSLGVAFLYVAADGIGYVMAGQPIDGPFVFRSVILPLTTVLAGYLREQTQQAEAALQERLRQSNALNEATAALGASSKPSCAPRWPPRLNCSVVRRLCSHLRAAWTATRAHCPIPCSTPTRQTIPLRVR